MKYRSLAAGNLPSLRKACVNGAGRRTGACVSPSSRRAGFTLIELLTVLAIFSVVSLLMTQIIIKSMELNRLAIGQLTQLITQGDLTRRFRSDVAAASGRLESLGSYQSGSDTLILDFTPTASPPPSTRQVIWKWDGTKLLRITWNEDSPQEVPLTPEQRYRHVWFETVQQDDALQARVRLEPYSLREPKALPEDQREDWKRRHDLVVEAFVGADRR